MRYEMNLTVTKTSKDGNRQSIEASFDRYEADDKEFERGDEPRERMRAIFLETLQIIG